MNSAPSTITFPDGLVGFAGPQRFVLVPWGGEDSPFSLLEPADGEEGPAFVVIPPATFFPDYELELDDETAGRAGLTSADDAVVLVIVNVRDDVREATANLLGPLVVNTRTFVGVQAVLNPDRFSSRRPLIAHAVAA